MHIAVGMSNLYFIPLYEIHCTLNAKIFYNTLQKSFAKFDIIDSSFKIFDYVTKWIIYIVPR